MLPKFKAASLYTATQVKEYLSPSKDLEATTDLPSNGWEYPGDRCCKAWDWTDFNADSIKFCLNDGEDYRSWKLSDHGWNDRIESWVCGKNVATWFCFEDENCRNNKDGESGAGSMSNAMMRRRNWYSSVYMYAYDSAKEGAITVFEDNDCRSTSAVYFAGSSLQESARYTEHDMWMGGMWANRANTVYVPFGYSARFYDSTTFSGDSVQIDGQAMNLSHFQMPCLHLGNLQDRVQSVEVWKNASIGAAVGEWK